MKKLFIILCLFALPSLLFAGGITDKHKAVVSRINFTSGACDQVQLPTEDGASWATSAVAQYDTSEMLYNRFKYGGTNGKGICQVDIWTSLEYTDTQRTYYVRIYNDALGDERLDGTHTSGTYATILTDSAATWDNDELIGLILVNQTDSSWGTITDNDNTTITVDDLADGVDGNFDENDVYFIKTAPNTSLGESDAVQFGTSDAGETQTAFVFSTPTTALTNGVYYHVVVFSKDVNNDDDYISWHRQNDTSDTAGVRGYSDYDPISWVVSSSESGWEARKFKLYSR